MRRLFFGNAAIAVLLLDDAADAWAPGNKVQVKRIISIGQPHQDNNVVPDNLIFPRRGDEEMRIKVQNFAFEFSGSSSSSTTAMSGTKASLEYVEAELMDDTFPQTGDYLMKEAKQFTSTSERQLSQAHKIQQAYDEWCAYYGKKPDKDRLGIFTQNFLAVQEFHERTGKPVIMNEYSDMTDEEWREMQQKGSSKVNGETKITAITTMESSSKKQVPQTTASTSYDDDHMRKAYKQWCQFYQKQETEKGLEAYIHNFIAVEKYHQQTNKALVLNEFADMTEEEYQRYMHTRAHFANSPAQLSPSDRTPHTASPVKQQSSGDHSFSYLRDAAPNGEGGALDSTMRDVVSALHSTVTSLNNVAKSLNQQGQPLVSPPQSSQSPQSSEQPLDSLVMDVLKKQDNNIADLEDSVIGLRDVQEQSGELIQLVSSNQMQMAEMMTSVQDELTQMQDDLRTSREESKALNDRVQRLESVLSKLNGIRSDNDSALAHQSAAPRVKPAGGMAYFLGQSQSKSITIEPNPIGLGMSMFTPKRDGTPDYDSHTLENRRRPHDHLD